jgi:cell division protein FtsI/penicillin-binding protein 2
MRCAATLCAGLILLAFVSPRQGVAPRDLRPELDIARPLQQAVDKAMAGRAGSAVVMDVETGRLLAHYRLDTAARTLAPPGSSIKPFTLLALLESGKLNPQQSLLCQRRVRIGERRLDCSHPSDTAPFTAGVALAYSCNSYFSELAALLTGEELAQAFTRAGLTTATGLAEREATGRARSPRTVEQRQLMALGEQNVEVTPLGLAAAYRKLALMRRQANPTAAQLAVFEGLEASVSYGMGRLAQTAGLPVAGKTGTASSGSGWTHAWFAGYAPAKPHAETGGQGPEIVVVIFLTQGRGGADAAPLAGEIFAAYAAAKGAP